MTKYTVENRNSVLFVSNDLSDALVKGLILSKSGEAYVAVNRVAETANGFRTSVVREYAA